ncbi:MAG: M23 family metallopeptidase [Nitrospirae bacterium]|nr:M23 family metallopeptidase [Nitrospirota bacterium]
MGKKFLKFFFIILIIAIIAALTLTGYKFFAGKPPVVTGTETLKKLSASTKANIGVDCNGSIQSVHVTILQGTKEVIVLDDKPQQSHKEYPILIEPAKLGLKDGSAQVIIKLSANRFSKSEVKIDTLIDTVPPIVGVLNNSYIAFQGGAASALIEAKGASRVYVSIGNDEFEATYKITGKENLYFAIFPIKDDVTPTTAILAVAVDTVGNKAKASISTRIKECRYKHDSINVSDDFINKKIYPLVDRTKVSGELTPKLALKIINEDMRTENEAFIRNICKSVSEKMLWEGVFYQMPNSKVFAGFNDARDYKYNGEVISHSKHLGFDLAANNNSPVVASNSGIVKYAGAIGIYGNTVIIDHGLGVMSQYSHLSSISVEVGKAVKKSEVIGISGETGLAGGVHLHFSTLVQGVYVTPIIWWDNKWIREKIMDVLQNKGTS